MSYSYADGVAASVALDSTCVPTPLFDRIFDLVDRKQKIFYVDLKELNLHTSAMDKLLKFLYVRGYVIQGDAFIYDDKI